VVRNAADHLRRRELVSRGKEVLVLEALVLVGGVARAVGGGELFVRATLGIPVGARVPPGIVGVMKRSVTLRAFATSAPELSVGIIASVAPSRVRHALPTIAP
jgi:hypothetical protein